MHHDNDNALGGLFALLISLVGFHLLANHAPILRTTMSVHPRHWDGIVGIYTHSLFHSSNQHLYNNLIGLFTLGTLVILVSPRQWWQITCWCSVIGGTLLFLFGNADTRTIGASGVIFGYLGYLMTVGIIHNRFVILLLSVAVVIVYGNKLQGMNPMAVAEHISWEGHIGGFVAGILQAFRTRLSGQQYTPAEEIGMVGRAAFRAWRQRKNRGGDTRL